MHHVYCCLCDCTASNKRAVLRRKGDGSRSQGLISSTAVACSLWHQLGSYPFGACALRQSPLQLKSVQHVACGQKDHLEGTKVAVFPSLCATQQDHSGSAADWRPLKSGDQGRRRAVTQRRGEPTPVPDLSRQWCCATATSGPAPGRGVRWCTNGAGTFFAPAQVLWFITRPTEALPRWLLASPATQASRCCRQHTWSRAS